MKTRTIFFVGAGLWGIVLGPAPASAQMGPPGIVNLCGGASAPALESCVRVGVGIEAARAGLGLAASGGAQLSGTTSTLGKRIGNMPRIALALRGGLTRASLPSFGAEGGGRNRWISSARLSAAVNLLQGFTVAPTLGGILSTDVIGEVSLVSPSGSDRFGESVWGTGLGLRVGIFRESFSAPGITITAMRRWLGDGAFGSDGEERAEFGTTVTSLRGIVGKDLLALGLHGGMGWDRYDGDATIQAFGVGPNPIGVQIEANGIEADRVLFFGGVSYNVLVWQFSAEGGWARGLEREGGVSGFDASDGSFFAHVALRFLY